MTSENREPVANPSQFSQVALRTYGILVILAFLAGAITHLIASIAPTNVLAGSVLTASSLEPMDAELVNRLQGFIGSIQFDDTARESGVVLRDRDGKVLADTLPDAVQLITANVGSKKNLQGGAFAALFLAFLAGLLLQNIRHFSKWLRLFPMVGVVASFAMIAPCLSCGFDDSPFALAPLFGAMMAVLLAILWTLNPRPTPLLANLTLILCVPIPLVQAAMLLMEPKFCAPCIFIGASILGMALSLLYGKTTPQQAIIDPGPLVATLAAIVVVSLSINKVKQLTGLADAPRPLLTERQLELMGRPADELLIGSVQPGRIYLIHQEGCRACDFAVTAMEAEGLSYYKISMEDEDAPIQPNLAKTEGVSTPTIYIFNKDLRVEFVRLGWPSDPQAVRDTIREMKRLTATSP